MTYRQLLETGQRLYTDYRSTNCQWLLAHLAKLSITELYANLDEISIVKWFELEALIKVNLSGKPLAYILKHQPFLGRDFFVNEDVLIPRSETEALVVTTEHLIANYFQSFKIKILDLATGSGVIAVSLALQQRDFMITASDISERALGVAKKNATKFNCNAIKFVKSDMLTYFIENKQQFDVIVANLPYISTNHPLPKSVSDYEPHLALYAGSDGLDYLRIFFKTVKQVLNSQFLLVLEIAHYQKVALSQLIKIHFAASKVKFSKDLNGYWRILTISNF